MIDYIIVGAGLAGLAFAETALRNNKQILVFENNSQTSSRIAGGLYNPVILKRFSALADAQDQLDAMKLFYSRIDALIADKFDFELPVLRKFFSVEEQNDWFIASDKVGLKNFLSTTIVRKQYNGIESPFGFGKVLQTGYVDTQKLLSKFHSFLAENNLYSADTFDYDAIEFKQNHIRYKNLEAKNIIFAEGYGMHQNPYFNYLPLDGTKGELFIIRAPDLDLDVIVNTNVFILPLGNDLFKVGATYEWDDKTNATTEAGKLQLLEKISEIITVDFEIVEHLAGVRPTVKDRKPLLGTHPQHKNLHILNGLGTRGVMLAPAMSQILYDHIENNIPIARENSITRFKL